MVEVRTAGVKVITGDWAKYLGKLLALGGEISIAVAYIDRQGFNIIEEALNASPDKIERVRLLVDLKSCATHPDAVDGMVRLEGEKPGRFQCKEYFIKGHPHSIMHSKLLISSREGSVTFLTGSCNLTQNAIERNKEHGIWVNCGKDQELGTPVLNDFEGLWGYFPCAVRIDEERAARYRELHRRNQREENRKERLEPAQRPEGVLGHWLFKCNPPKHQYSYLNLVNDHRTCWGQKVENTPSLKMLRDEVKVGDMVIFYHTDHEDNNLPKKAALGTAQVVWRNVDEKNPLVQIWHRESFSTPVTLSKIKVGGRKLVLQNLGQMMSKTHTRSTVQPITPVEYAEIVRLGTEENQE